ncbi:MAG: insulinase family protein [Clostridia bacterium]|nr:insulinase family protein [Clostridia bacterium]
MKKIEIKKGINLYLFPEKKFKTYYAGVYFHTPLNADTATENALLPLVLKRGSKNYPTKASISEKLDMLMGASFSAYVQKKGESQLLSFSISGVSDSFAPFGECFKDGINLLADVALNPIIPFDEEYLKSEKQHLSEIIESEKNDKRHYSVLRCKEEMNKGTPYAVPESGYAGKIEEISPESLEKRYYDIISSSPVDILVVGNFDEDSAAGVITACLSRLPERNCDYPVTTPSLPEDVSTVTEAMAVSQGKLCIGFTTPVPSAMSEDYAALTVYNSIFGGGAHSKLFMNVREKLSLAYYAGSSYERAKGIIIVSSGIESKNFEKARDEIFLQHKAMTDGDITDTELAVSKKALINSLKATGDSVGSIAAFSLSSILQNMTLTREELAERIDNVTKEDIVRVGKNIAPKTIYFLKGADR